ncbi:hypothetical protein RLIN73S_06970 [Rhodanobacter lindaniclasticus]
MLGGPTLRSEIIDTAEQIRVMGVVFHPGGAHVLTGEDATTLAGRDVDLGDVFGGAAARLRDQLLHTAAPCDRLRLLTRWLARRLRGNPVHPAIACALQRLAEQPQVQRIAPLVREAGLSERRFGMLFQRQVGMRPKHYARLLRFRAVVDHAQARPTVNWSQVAADGGYFEPASPTSSASSPASRPPRSWPCAGHTRTTCRWTEQRKFTRRLRREGLQRRRLQLHDPEAHPWYFGGHDPWLPE